MAELIKSRPMPVRTPSQENVSARSRVEGLFSNDEEQAPNAQLLRSMRKRNLAKIAALAVAALVLCGSLGAASLIDDNRRAKTAEATVKPVVEAAAGKRALIPDLPDVGQFRTRQTPVGLTPALSEGVASGTAYQDTSPTNATIRLCQGQTPKPRTPRPRHSSHFATAAHGVPRARGNPPNRTPR